VAHEVPNATVGNAFHEIPVRATNRIPSSTARSATGKRPGNRNLRSRAGINRFNRGHSSSVSTVADTARASNTLPDYSIRNADSS